MEDGQDGDDRRRQAKVRGNGEVELADDEDDDQRQSEKNQKYPPVGEPVTAERATLPEPVGAHDEVRLDDELLAIGPSRDEGAAQQPADR